VLENPYTPGQIPRVLAGRAVEKDQIRGHLSRVSTFGELGGPLLVFHAARGVGKTSLLREGQRDAEEHGFVTTWVSCARRQRFLPELADRVAHALEAADVVPASDRNRWRTRLTRFGVQAGPPGLKVSAEVTPVVADEGAENPAPIAALEDLLHDAASLVRDRGGAGLAVFLDELHAPDRDDTAIFLNALQNLDGQRDRNPLAVFGAGLPSTPEELTRAATFGERSAFVALGLLDERAAEQALVEPAAALGVAWEPAAVAAVERQARGYPYFLQLIAHAAFAAAAPGEGATITVTHVEAAGPAAHDQLQSMYRARWKAASRLEQELMAAMAGVGTDAVSRSDIAAAMGRDSQALSVPRDRLMDKGVIESAGRGLLRFTLPGFGDYVRDRNAG
jgi:AAA ATPase domain